MTSNAASLRNWAEPKYVPGEWLDYARAPAIVRSIIITNPSTDDASVSVRLSDGGGIERAVILPDTLIEAGKSYVIDLCQLNLGRSDVLQVMRSGPGVSVVASGEALG